MATYEDLSTQRASLIRKALGGFILVAPMDTAVPDKLFEEDGSFVDFKAEGWENLGWLSQSDGITFPREVEVSDVLSFGAQEPTRTDITSDVTSATFVCQETNKKVLELFHNLDLDDVTPDANNELSFDQPTTPETVYRRFLYIAKDGNGDNAKYIAKLMPRATVSEYTEQSWSNESELSYGLTIKATQDEKEKFAIRHIFGGPGFAGLWEDMGFTQGATD